MHRTRSFFFFMGVLLTVCLAAPAVWAQGVDIPMIVTGSHDQNTWVNATYAHQFEVDADSGPDGTNPEFSRHSTQFVAGTRAEVSDDLFLVFNGSYQGSYYDFDKGSGAATQLHWNDIHRTTLVAGLGWKNDDWTVIGLLLGRSEGESGAEVDDSLTGGGALLVDYKWSDDLSTGFILGAISTLEDSASIIPLPTVDWRFADHWKFHFGLVSGAGFPGVGPEVSYLGDNWQFGVGGSYQKRRYRLDSRSHPNRAAIDEGIGEETSFPIFARAAYAPNKNMNFGVTAGVAVAGEIRSGTHSGTKIYKEDYDPAPILGFNANFMW